MELRRYPRTPMKAEVWIGQDGIFTRTPETPSDLSEGGAFVETSQKFSRGSILNLRLKLPGEIQPIDCTVAVRNEKARPGLGLQFLDISPENGHIVSSFIHEAALA